MQDKELAELAYKLAKLTLTRPKNYNAGEIKALVIAQDKTAHQIMQHLKAEKGGE